MNRTVQLIRLAFNRNKSPANYRAMQTFIAEQAIDEIERRGIAIADCDVLEIGAGLGGYSKVMNRRARRFCASDLTFDTFFVEQGIPFVQLDATRPFPFLEKSFDLVYCSSLIEHVRDPLAVLSECQRVLRSSGFLYVSFPPFYSLALVGGHEFKPYHLLGERLAVSNYNRRYGREITSYATMFQNWGLYRLTIAEVRRYLERTGFDIEDVYTRLSPINTAQLPGILKDLATWHACFLARPRYGKGQPSP